MNTSTLLSPESIATSIATSLGVLDYYNRNKVVLSYLPFSEVFDHLRYVATNK